MKIQSNSSANNTPEWFFPSKKENLKNKKNLSGVERINTTASSKIDEKILEDECNYIESCVNNKIRYCCNSNWPKNVIAHLREYAIVSGLPSDSFILFDPTDLQVEAESKNMVKTASSNNVSEENELSKIWKDPFKINEKLNEKSNVKDNWEKVSSYNKLGDKPNLSGISAIRGGENYYENSPINTASNQNSILASDKLDRLANSEEIDTGVRLREERKIRDQKIEEEKASQWKEIGDAATEGMKGYTSGTVFPTESLVANSGIHSKKSGVYSDFDPNSIPDLTEGEMIKSANEQRRKSIQKEKQEDRSWDKIEKANVRTISDDLADGLKKFLK